MNSDTVLTQKDTQRRDLVLQGNLWRAILQIGLPLAFYQSLNQLFRILDTMMASHISAQTVSAVAYLSQINMMLAAVGGGLAVGASIKVSEAYGAGDYELVRKRVSTLFAFCGMLGLCAVAIIPFTGVLLRCANTPPEFMKEGTRYFRIGLAGLVLIFFNNGYIAIERARGNAGRILWLNLASITIKLSSTAYFVYVRGCGITMIAVTSLMSDFFITAAGILELCKKDGIFGFSLRSIQFTGDVAPPMLQLSFPVMVEKVAFSFGKVVVNSMSTAYGALTVGALGISNNIGGITTNPQNGFQEAGSSVISQNIGAGNQKRALQAFKILSVVNLLVGLLGYCFTMFFLPQISSLFASGDAAFAELIASIYVFEAVGSIPLGLCSSVTALLYSFGYTRLTLLINFSRVFIFRIPVLWALQQFTALGSRSVGVVMMVSNVLVSLFAVIISFFVIRHICWTENIVFWGKDDQLDRENRGAPA